MIPLLVPAALGLIGGYLAKEPKKYHLGGVMNKHLAPNGEQSNLTHEQWHLVRTPAFKNWFGDWEKAYKTKNYEGVSKIIDENGEPLVCFHGTTHKFYKFSKKNANPESFFGQGYYFTDSRYDADANYLSIGSDLTNRIGRLAEKIQDDKGVDYEKAKELAAKKLIGKEEQILEVFLNFKNPLNLTENGTRYDAYEIENEDGYIEINEQGLTSQLNGALIEVSSDFADNGSYGESIFNQVSENIGYDWDGVKASTIDELIRNTEEMSETFLDDEGNLISHEYLRSVYERMGFDGVIMDADKQFGSGRKFGRKMAMDVGTKHYIGFYPTQIKLADGRNVKFSPKNADIRYKKGGEIDNKLVALHNISPSNIIDIDRLGGMVTPSIAIIKSGEKFTDFGSITLITTKEMINPENWDVRVYSGDVYSPTVPPKRYYISRQYEKDANELVRKAYQFNREIAGIVSNLVEDYASFSKDLSRKNADELIYAYLDDFRIIYLLDNGIDFKVPMQNEKQYLYGSTQLILTDEEKKIAKELIKKYSKETEASSRDLTPETSKEIYELFRKIITRDVKASREEIYKEAGIKLDIEEDVNSLLDRYIGDGTFVRAFSVDKLAGAVNPRLILDKDKLKVEIKKKFNKKVEEEYKEWFRNFIYKYQGSAYFEKGNEKLSYNLDNLVDATNSYTRGQQRLMTFGMNQAKSYGVKQFKSIDEIKKASNKLVPKEEEKKIHEENQEQFFKLSERLRYAYSDTWSKLDSLGKAIADYYKGKSARYALSKNDFVDFQYDIESFKDFADTLKNSPVDYFEAKMLRAVKLNEFKYAVVPKKVDKKVVEILKKNGVVVKFYNDYQDDERTNIVNKIIARDKAIAFQKGGIFAEGGSLYSKIFYHGSTDKNLSGKNGIHVGTKLAATQALESRIGVPAEGEWDGTREYGKTLLAGKKRLQEISKERGYYVDTGYNVDFPPKSLPEENYYPTERKQRATYSDKTPISFDSKPIVFPVIIIGAMSNSKSNPHSDIRANSMMLRNLKMGNARKGYYYTNIGEDEGSISAVVPDKTFLRIVENYAKGGRTIAQTPAPKKERIYGSSINKPKSAESRAKAKKIHLNAKTISSIKSILEKHNTEYPSKKIPIASAKAVVRRGMGAYSSSHRPTISGGKPNSRVAWGLARLNAFVYKIQKGKSKSGKYHQDDDLIKELGYRVSKS